MLSKSFAHHLEPWHQISGTRVLRVSYPFIPYWCSHIIRQPYRRPLGIQPSSATLRLRGRIAAYDSVINLVIDGYGQLADHGLCKLTGPLAIVFNRLVGAFDDEFERRLLAGRQLAFADILESESVRGRMQDLRDLLAPYPTGPAVRDFLDGWVAKQYDRYIDLMMNDASNITLDECFEAAAIDSGGFATCIAHVIGLFHGVTPSERMISQFSTLGVVGKFADDFVDFWADVQKNRVNLLDAFIRQNPVEYDRTRTVITCVPRTGLRWWVANCPRATAAFSETLDYHTSRLNTPALHQAARAMLLPAMWGKTLLKAEPVNLRL